MPLARCSSTTVDSCWFAAVAVAWDAPKVQAVIAEQVEPRLRRVNAAAADEDAAGAS